jgi:DNA-directed RNA polymerase subunit RPC12/RpoP
MIRFKCIYCGQKVTVKDELCGKKGKCPKCSHTILIPESTKDRPILDPDISEGSQKMMEACAMLELATQKEFADEDVPFGCEKPAWFVPKYDKLSLFLMAITFVILAVINSTVQKDILQIIKIGLGGSETGALIIILVTMSFAGMGLSLYYMFSNKEAGDTEKKLMVTFAAVISAVTAGLASYHILKFGSISGILLIFPIWNLINAVLILMMLYLKIINRNCIIERKISFFRVVFSLTLSIIILLLCECIFKMYWAVTFSICMVYTTSIDSAIQNTISGKLNTKE